MPGPEPLGHMPMPPLTRPRHVTIQRVTPPHPTKASPGILYIDGAFQCFTLELPWKDNHPNVSCIPTGTYPLHSYPSKRFGMTFLVMNVPGRSGILIHPGNTIGDIEGCILAGEMLDVEPDGWKARVLRSRVAVTALQKRLNKTGGRHTLTIHGLE